MERNRFDLEIDLFHRLHSINDCAPFELLTIDLLLSRMYTFVFLYVYIFIIIERWTLKKRMIGEKKGRENI